MTKFADLGLSPKVLQAVEAAGYTQPTPIQADAIPHALQGKDVLDTTCSFDDPSWQSFGCVDDAEMDQVVILCGNGSGAACTSDSCQGTETLLTCDYGLQTAMLDCLTICNDSSFDNGECGEQDGVDQCLCFDDTTNTSDSDSGGSSSTSDSSGSTG